MTTDRITSASMFLGVPLIEDPISQAERDRLIRELGTRPYRVVSVIEDEVPPFRSHDHQRKPRTRCRARHWPNSGQRKQR